MLKRSNFRLQFKRVIWQSLETARMLLYTLVPCHSNGENCEAKFLTVFEKNGSKQRSRTLKVGYFCDPNGHFVRHTPYVDIVKAISVVLNGFSAFSLLICKLRKLFKVQACSKLLY